VDFDDDSSSAATTGPSTRSAQTRPESSQEKIKRHKAHHANVIAARKDILVYTSAALDKPLTIAGPLSAVIYASSSATDTDWFVRLVEVSPDGQLWTRGEGRLRASFRASNQHPEPIEPGTIYEYHLDLWQTGVEFPAKSRLRVEVCSADFPLFSRNLNTGGHSETETRYVTARQTIYHDAAHPSHVLLPVIPPELMGSHPQQ